MKCLAKLVMRSLPVMPLLAAGSTGACAQTASQSASTAPLREPVSALGMVPTFADDFQGSSIDFKKWVAYPPDGSSITERTMANNAERQVYFNQAYLHQGVRVFALANGVLKIIASPMTPPVRAAVQAEVAKLAPSPAATVLKQLAYTSGRVTTRGKFSQLYGYFEIRARNSAGKGLWPAFWLLPADGGWPPEIDVMEILGHEPTIVHSTVHSGTMPEQGSVATLQPTSDGFHRYGVLWSSKTITYYIDGIRAATATTPSDAHKPMYMIVNLAVGGYWPGDPDASTAFPATFEIDAVRAWKFRDAP